jgi:hypothetical protein
MLDDVIELCTYLLENSNIWVSSNAALVIARISIEDSGCDKLLSHSKCSQLILEKLVQSLGCDNAGRGMNCAFALGRICDSEKGRYAILQINNLTLTLIKSLYDMIEQNLDTGCTKNACYALSCLSSDQQAHVLITEHDCFNNLLNTLSKILLTINDPETQWFAAMLLKMFCSYPNGCMKMRSDDKIKNSMKELLKNEDLYTDVREEVNVILENLKPLEKPGPVRCKVNGSYEVFCEWETFNNSLIKQTVKYILFKSKFCVFIIIY